MVAKQGCAHTGLRDWWLQRLSALVIAAYVLCLLGYWYVHVDASFGQWHDFLFATTMRVFSSLTLLAIVLHAWLGLWTVLTDYIKPRFLRAALQQSVILVLGLSAVWGLQSVWIGG